MLFLLLVLSRRKRPKLRSLAILRQEKPPVTSLTPGSSLFLKPSSHVNTNMVKKVHFYDDEKDDATTKWRRSRPRAMSTWEMIYLVIALVLIAFTFFFEILPAVWGFLPSIPGPKHVFKSLATVEERAAWILKENPLIGQTHMAWVKQGADILKMATTI